MPPDTRPEGYPHLVPSTPFVRLIDPQLAADAAESIDEEVVGTDAVTSDESFADRSAREIPEVGDDLSAPCQLARERPGPAADVVSCPVEVVVHPCQWRHAEQIVGHAPTLGTGSGV